MIEETNKQDSTPRVGVLGKQVQQVPHGFKLIRISNDTVARFDRIKQQRGWNKISYNSMLIIILSDYERKT